MGVPENFQLYIYVAQIILLLNSTDMKGVKLPNQCFNKYHINCRINASTG